MRLSRRDFFRSGLVVALAALAQSKPAQAVVGVGAADVITAANVAAAGVVAGDSRGTILTAGSANVKGGYTQLLASTAFAVKGILVSAQVDASDDFLLDLATGAATSESVVLADLLLAGPGTIAANDLFHYVVYFPLTIASGTRLAARCQATTGSATCQVEVLLVGQGPTVDSIATYGATGADSGGTAITPSGTANTKGTYTQLTASTSAVIRWLFVCVGFAQQTTASATQYLLDLSTGAATSESVLIPDLSLRLDINQDFLFPPVWGPFPVYVAAGTRLAARVAGKNGGDPAIDVVLYGLTG